MNKTIFGKFEGNAVHVNGMPKRVVAFDGYTAGVDYVEINTSTGYGSKRTYLTKHTDGVWRSPVWMSGDNYMCYELRAKRVNYALELVRLSDEKGKAILSAAVASVLEDAEKVIDWCDPKDETDSEGRYWLSAYRGCGVYRVVVAAGKIRGAIYGGFHDCNRTIRCHCAGDMAFMKALYQVVEKHLGTQDFRMLKADGSGTRFYLRNQEDAVHLETKEYDVPSATGGQHHNIEVT